MTSVWRELSDRCNEHWNVEEMRESSRREDAKRQGCVFLFFFFITSLSNVHINQD